MEKHVIIEDIRRFSESFNKDPNTLGLNAVTIGLKEFSYSYHRSYDDGNPVPSDSNHVREGQALRERLTSEISVRLLAMSWYCPKCKSNFTEYQPMCPFCNIRLRKSSWYFE